LTRTHKVLSDLSVQLLGQVASAIEINEISTKKLYWLTIRILRESARRKMNSKPIGTAAEFGILHLFNKKKYEKRVRSYKDKERHLENSLDDAIKRIQKTNAKKMFLIIKMNMIYGPEKTIDYIIESFENIESIEINGMTFLVGEVRKVA